MGKVIFEYKLLKRRKKYGFQQFLVELFAQIDCLLYLCSNFYKQIL